MEKAVLEPTGALGILIMTLNNDAESTYSSHITYYYEITNEFYTCSSLFISTVTQFYIYG